ncbi:hypothetical protein [Flammeovirga agarivorans]|uniref:Uncharacterized protein n=1 Tax=Flammeovirga agarivorans TaxID=2726742 RepID=A0A7X8SJR8_9BACT|nr:hypothetical protein [Flammeovirga agarivorans]NLR91402.1 hypothetical protein [Flammeovirga agarivorans]
MKHCIFLFILLPICSFGQILDGEYLSTLIVESEKKPSGTLNSMRHQLISLKFNKDEKSVVFKNLKYDKSTPSNYTQTGNRITFIDHHKGSYIVEKSDGLIILTHNINDSTSTSMYLIELPPKRSNLNNRNSLHTGTLKINHEKTQIKTTGLGLVFTSNILGNREYKTNKVNCSGYAIFYLKNSIRNPMPVFIVKNGTDSKMSGTLLVYDFYNESDVILQKYKFQIKK